MENLAKQVHDLFLERGMTVATAESCTGGLLSAQLTERAGSSAFFLGGICCYSNLSKVALVGVPQHTLDSCGAVSEEVARALAYGARQKFSTDFGIGITGIAGPGGGSLEKPVGTVWCAIVSPQQIDVSNLKLSGGRAEIRRKTVEITLKKLITLLNG